MTFPPQRRRVVAAAPRRQPAELRAVRVVFEPDPESGMCAYAEADVTIEGIEQTLTSRGCDGIEDDEGDDELDEIIDGEWRVLRGVLKTVGVSTDQLPTAVDRAWISWRT